MARDYGVVYHDIWADDDFRELSRGAQLLYVQLLTSATLSYAGVADWRPSRLCALSGDADADAVVEAGAELAAGMFLVVDANTEEVLIRSFLKHDGLLTKPNVTKAMVKAFDRIYSPVIRGVIVHELFKLREAFPDWAGFRVPGVPELFEKSPIDPSELVPFASRNPLSKGSVRGSDFDPSLLTTTTNDVATTKGSPQTVNGFTPAALESAFDEAWSHWPKKVERKPALEKFKAKARVLGVPELVAAVTRFGDAYAATTDRQFVPGLAVWLNKERWTDELPQRGNNDRTGSAVSTIDAGARLQALADRREIQ